MQEMTCSCAISPQRGAVSRTVRGRFWLRVSPEHSDSETSGDCLVAGLSAENSQELWHHCPLRAYLLYAPQALFCLFSEELEAATFLCQRFIAPDTEECRLLVSHTQNQQTTSEEPLQSLRDNFLIITSLFLIFFSSRERERRTPARQFHAVRSDMTSLSILFAISPGTWSSSDS